MKEGGIRGDWGLSPFQQFHVSFPSLAEDRFGALICKCAPVVTTTCLCLFRFTGLEPGSMLCAFRSSQVPYMEEKKVKVKSRSRVPLFAIPWTVAYQVPVSMEFSRQEYWSGLPLPSPGDLSSPGIEPRSPTLEADALPPEPTWKRDGDGAGCEQKGQAPCLMLPAAGTASLHTAQAKSLGPMAGLSRGGYPLG